MLHKASKVMGGRVEASDGLIGAVEDLYFDDERWGLRYLVVVAGDWLDRRRVLLSPASVVTQHSTDQHLLLDITRQQVRDSPPVDADKPVSRRYEIAHARHYRYSPYWNGPLLWGAAAYPAAAYAAALVDPPLAQRGAPALAHDEIEAAEATHLRSCSEVIGYGVRDRTGDAGQVDDVMIEARDWSVRGLVVDTRLWLPGGQVLVPPDAVSSIDWASRSVRVELDRESLRELTTVS